MALHSFKGPVTLGIAASMVIGFIVSICSKSASDAAEFIPLFCPIKTFLAIDCPTCGLGRSLAFAFRGEWNESLNTHPFGVPLLILSLLGICFVWLAPKTFKRTTERLREFHMTHPTALVAIIGLYCIWGFGRNY